MKKVKKIVTTFLISSVITVGVVQAVYAKTSAYLIKDTSSGIVFEYDKATLNKGLVNYTLKGSDAYYESFDAKRNSFSLYAFGSDTGKYVDSKEVNSALKKAALSGQSFNLDNYIDSSSSPSLSITSKIQSVVLENGQVKFVDKTAGQEDVLEVISIE